MISEYPYLVLCNNSSLFNNWLFSTTKELSQIIFKMFIWCVTGYVQCKVIILPFYFIIGGFLLHKKCMQLSSEGSFDVEIIKYDRATKD